MLLGQRAIASAEGGRLARGYEHRDLVMSAVWILWEEGVSDREWLRSKLQVDIGDIEDAY